jgi:imidazolonepropionase-like amidohydrolase
MHRIEADLLIPGRGAPVSDAVVVLDGPLISYAGPAGVAPPTPGAPVTRVTAVMPGMWECHGHLLGTRTFDLGQLPLEPDALRAARCTRDLRAALDAGITSVRDVGGLGIYLARVVDEGVIDGPAIYGAGGILSTTGGHGDLHSFPLDWMRDYSAQGGLMRLADGPDECAKAVREQLRRNAKVIKVCASGGVLSEVDDPIHQQFTVPELRVIVEVAGLADRVVAAHCHGKPASWRRCGPGCGPSSTAPTWTTSAATRCAKPMRSWSRPGRSSRTCWLLVTWCRPTRWPSWTPSPTCTPMP